MSIGCCRMEESFSLKRSYSDVMPDDDPKASKRNGSIGRRSFFKRRSGRHQHQRSGSKDSRELTSFSDLSTSNDNVPVADDGAPLLYQRVEKIQCKLKNHSIKMCPFSYIIYMSISLMATLCLYSLTVFPLQVNTPGR